MKTTVQEKTRYTVSSTVVEIKVTKLPEIRSPKMNIVTVASIKRIPRF